MGKRFCGEDPDEERRFFESGITPRPSPPRCNLVGDVIYLDAKNSRGFGCSLLPHRDGNESGGGVAMYLDGEWRLDVPQFEHHVRWFRGHGPSHCRGCSTMAAGYSDAVGRSAAVDDWSF